MNYVTRFEQELRQKYARELLTDGLTTQRVSFINAQTVKLPTVTTSGYKDHSRSGGFNRDRQGGGGFNRGPRPAGQGNFNNNRGPRPAGDNTPKEGGAQ